MSAPTFKPENIPAELRALRHWIGWKRGERDGKPTKVPVAIDGGATGTTVTWRHTWAAFDDAVAAVRAGNVEGVGFVFTDTPFVGIDLDFKADKAPDEQPFGPVFQPDGSLAQWSGTIVERFASYAEVSQSRNGLHVIVKGALPPGRKRKGQIEAYDASSPRYFAMTGDAIGERRDVLQDDGRLARFHARYLADEESPAEQPAAPATALLPADQELIDRILQTPADRVTFQSLFYHGLGADARHVDKSRERFKLELLLCRHTGDDEQVKRFMWASALRDPKWERHRTLLDIDVRNARKAEPGPVAPSADGKLRWELLTSDAFVNLPKPAWLAWGMLVTGCLTLLYGMKGAYKSFVAHSIACTVARALDGPKEAKWLGKYAVAGGVVVYVVAEGQGYFGERIDAEERPAHVRYVTVPVNLFRGEAAAFATCVQAQLPEGEQPVLFVFDTLARSMVGGEENSNTDMGVVVDASGLLQRAFGAAVLLVHHTGKDGLTSRGGYALECAADIILRLDKTGPTTVTLVFQNEKFIAEPPNQGLKLVPRRQSLVVEAADAVATPARESRRHNAIAERRDKIVELCRTEPKSKADLCEAVGIGSRAMDGDVQVLLDCTPPRLTRRGAGTAGDPYLYVASGLRPLDTV